MDSEQPTMTDSSGSASNGAAPEPDVVALWRGAEVSAREAQEWDSYWNSLNDSQPIFRLEAGDYVQRFTRAFPGCSTARVLDFGCGFGLLSEALSAHVGEIVVWDSSSNMRRIAYRRLAAKNNVGFATAPGIEQDTSLGTFDFILVNSVVQYMTFEELCGWLARWKELVDVDGRIVVSDIVTPDYSFFRDLTAFLAVCLRNGVFLRSLWAGMKEIGNYSTIKSSQPLLKLDATRVSEAAASAGLHVDILEENLTYHHGRITAVYRHRRPAA